MMWCLKSKVCHFCPSPIHHLHLTFKWSREIWATFCSQTEAVACTGGGARRYKQTYWCWGIQSRGLQLFSFVGIIINKQCSMLLHAAQTRVFSKYIWLCLCPHCCSRLGTKTLSWCRDIWLETLRSRALLAAADIAWPPRQRSLVCPMISNTY